MKIDEKIYKRISFAIVALFVFSFSFLVFNLQFTGGTIFNMFVVSVIVGLILNSIVTEMFSNRHFNNITYWQRIIITPLFFLVILLSIFAYKSVYLVKDYKAKYDLVEFDKNDYKQKLDKSEKEVTDLRSKNYDLNRDRINKNSKKKEKDFLSDIPQIPKEKPKKRKGTGARIGAICCDGTRSYATGRGACSWHGGVCEWLYDN